MHGKSSNLQSESNQDGSELQQLQIDEEDQSDSFPDDLEQKQEQLDSNSQTLNSKKLSSS